jgi:hypothetical protein
MVKPASCSISCRIPWSFSQSQTGSGASTIRMTPSASRPSSAEADSEPAPPPHPATSNEPAANVANRDVRFLLLRRLDVVAMGQPFVAVQD